MKKTLLTAIAALSLLLSGWVAASTPYAKQKSGLSRQLF